MINQLKKSNVALGYVKNGEINSNKERSSQGRVNQEIGATKNMYSY